MSEVKDFLKALSGNPEAKKLMKEAKEPASLEEAAALYADIAEKTGISVTKETIQEFLAEKEKVQQAQSAKAESAVKEALSDEALETVAGGGDYEKVNEECSSTYNPGEWCWFSDSCSVIISYYDGSGQPAQAQDNESVSSDSSSSSFDSDIVDNAELNGGKFFM